MGIFFLSFFFGLCILSIKVKQHTPDWQHFEGKNFVIFPEPISSVTLIQGFEHFCLIWEIYPVLSVLIWKSKSESFPGTFHIVLPPVIKSLEAIKQEPFVMLVTNSDMHWSFITTLHSFTGSLQESVGMWLWIPCSYGTHYEQNKKVKDLRVTNAWTERHQ